MFIKITEDKVLNHILNQYEPKDAQRYYAYFFNVNGKQIMIDANIFCSYDDVLELKQVIFAMFNRNN